MALGNSVNLLGLMLLEAGVVEETLRGGVAGEVGHRGAGELEGGAKNPHAHFGISEVLPAEIGHFKTADQSTTEGDQPAGGGGDDDASMGDGKETMLDCPGLDDLPVDENRA